LHPQLVSERHNELGIVKRLISQSRYIGEVGLDFSRQYYSSKDKQIEVFESIAKWCGEIKGRVISIHSVHADKQVLDILEKTSCAENNICIMHWFSGAVQQLLRAVEMGCYFSVNGAMCRSANGQKLIHRLPQAKILLESDAPFVDGVDNEQLLKNHLNYVRDYLQKEFNDELPMKISQTSAALLS
jgi:TatD DNase family protein